MSHTQGKWKYREEFNGIIISNDGESLDIIIASIPFGIRKAQENIANAKRIVQAVNSFDALLAALKETNAALKTEIDGGTGWKFTINHAEQAITQAEAE